MFERSKGYGKSYRFYYFSNKFGIIWPKKVSNGRIPILRLCKLKTGAVKNRPHPTSG
jgi:hypothetical protein